MPSLTIQSSEPMMVMSDLPGRHVKPTCTRPIGDRTIVRRLGCCSNCDCGIPRNYPFTTADTLTSENV